MNIQEKDFNYKYNRRLRKRFRTNGVLCKKCVGFGSIICRDYTIEPKDVFKVIDCNTCAGTGIEVIPFSELNR